ncbi:unnamed protein product [Prorocentrum cordatum]|uniref:Uncharacterized protein n=1 Tax=Prorocentrum cordatum TaxID=2364126 RepID=A0ABN9QA81_9DINO|nr:unnamed protein product [Polarella glacialis]
MPIAMLALHVMLVSAVAQAGFACHLIFRSLPTESICATYKYGPRACWNALVSVVRKTVLPSGQDPLDQKIRQMIIRSRLEVFAFMLPIGLAQNTWLLLNDFIRNRVWTVLAWSWYGRSSGEDVAELLSPWLMILFRQLMTLLFLAFPRLINPSCIRVGVSMVYLRLTIEAFMRSETDFASWVAITAPTRLGASVMLGEPWTATCLNVVLSAVSCWCYHAEWHINFHVVHCCITLAIIYGLDCVRYAQFRAVLEARMSHSVEVAADGLLTRLCDAVVHMGEDLRITQPSPHLAALLLRQCSEEQEQHNHKLSEVRVDFFGRRRPPRWRRLWRRP